MTLIRKIETGCNIPAGYAVAWCDWVEDAYFVAPLPIALPIALGRHLYAGLLTFTRDVARDPRVAFLDGIEHGYRHAASGPQPPPGFIAKAGHSFRRIMPYTPGNDSYRDQGA